MDVNKMFRVQNVEKVNYWSHRTLLYVHSLLHFIVYMIYNRNQSIKLSKGAIIIIIVIMMSIWKNGLITCLIGTPKWESPNLAYNIASPMDILLFLEFAWNHKPEGTKSGAICFTLKIRQGYKGCCHGKFWLRFRNSREIITLKIDYNVFRSLVLSPPNNRVHRAGVGITLGI